MRFEGSTRVAGTRDAVWEALHDPAVLRDLVVGCESMTALPEGTYAATMVARVGPVRDTYRGTFAIDDHRPGEELHVRMRARGRCGRLELRLLVRLTDVRDGARGVTDLEYRADASVGGLVSRVAGAALRLTGDHLTRSFFDGLDAAVADGARASALQPA